MKTLLLISALGVASIGNGQPKDAPINVPIGTVDTFYCLAWFQHWNYEAWPDSLIPDSSLLVEAWAFQLVDERELTPYVGEGGPCRPSGSIYWKEVGRAQRVWQGTSTRHAWLSYYYIPEHLGNTEGFLNTALTKIK